MTTQREAARDTMRLHVFEMVTLAVDHTIAVGVASNGQSPAWAKALFVVALVIVVAIVIFRIRRR